ncbi:hypothetical protein WG902_02365 [Ramlibacter sp. PS3R-8]|uniref:hypothetical protein n=1 Tax=Ramlibacter sp. PS3R-8 TaxID=3133437 RepID=UPI0030AA084C
MAKRSIKAAPEKVPRPPETKPAWAADRHSGEGAASALETLQKMEKSRVAGQPAEPRVDPLQD